MTQREKEMLNTILGKVEHLQNKTKDDNAKERLMAAKNELLRLYKGE